MAEKRLGSCAPVKVPVPLPRLPAFPLMLAQCPRRILTMQGTGAQACCSGAAGVHPGPRDCAWPRPQSLRRAAHPFLLSTGLLPRGFRPWQTQFPPASLWPLPGRVFSPGLQRVRQSSSPAVAAPASPLESLLSLLSGRTKGLGVPGMQWKEGRQVLW